MFFVQIFFTVVSFSKNIRLNAKIIHSKTPNLLIARQELVKTSAGDYIVYYTDAAGNVSSYYFTMRVFFNASAWIYVILVVVIIGAAIGYKIFVRKKLTTR